MGCLMYYFINTLITVSGNNELPRLSAEFFFFFKKEGGKKISEEREEERRE